MARLGSAKAPTPVRIRTMPLKPSRKLGGFFMFKFLEKLIKDMIESVQKRREMPLKPSRKLGGFFMFKFFRKIN